ncbi:MAG TPA: aminopeptidase [Candidatus Nitrosocosmicus sp.]|nr:aminopeptidase [Candidatus Nitrosocosmicus sp.]
MYTPPKEILEKYAKVLINFALNSGEGIKKGDVVYIQVSEVAKPMYVALRNEVIKAGGTYISSYMPDDVSREAIELSSMEQLTTFHEKYYRGLIDTIDHSVYMISETNKHELEGVDPKKIMERGKAFKPFMEWRNEKENNGKFTWTLGLYGTEAMAKEANMSLEEYWQEIIKACYLDEEDPIAKWKEVTAEIDRVKNTLNALEIEKLHITGNDLDLTIGMGKQRKWLGGSGRNIPSFELFFSPDWRMTEGKIKFNQPLYRYGSLITGIELTFEKGEVVKATAEKNEELLLEMIKSDEGAKRVGEYSLTDSRMSRITRFMGETLFDENMGGEFGNTHLALGMSYHDTYNGDPSKVTKEEWAEMGFNDSVIHTDIISTTDRTATAILANGEEKVIYKDGKFTV